MATQDALRTRNPLALASRTGIIGMDLSDKQC